MDKNPYTVLGVAENATDEQVKSAYRSLAKKYHPDNYEDSPLRDLATDKMKEINEAYDEIMKLRKEGKTYSSDRASRTNGGYTAEGYTRTNYPDVRNYIRAGRLDDAQVILNGVPADRRDAEWNFLMGLIYYRRGWTDEAYNYFRIAYEKEPQNPEFRQAFDRMNRQRSYTSTEYNKTYPSSNSGCSSCDICSALCCADTCCECMGGDCIRCC
ncbi:MAG: J domain-containing protein [Ruminococcus sp.]